MSDDRRSARSAGYRKPCARRGRPGARAPGAASYNGPWRRMPTLARGLERGRRRPVARWLRPRASRVRSRRSSLNQDVAWMMSQPTVPSKRTCRRWRRGRNVRRVSPKSHVSGNVAPSSQTARTASSGDMGWCAQGCRSQAKTRATGTTSPTTRGSRPDSARACHAAGARESSFSPLTIDLGCPQRRPRSVEPRPLPGPPFLGAIRPRSSGRRSRFGEGAVARHMGVGRPNRQSHQPARATAGARLVGSLPRTRPRHSTRGAARAGIRAVELLQAPPGSRGRRSPELGAMVRWLGHAARCASRPAARRGASNLAGRNRMAAGRGGDLIR